MFKIVGIHDNKVENGVLFFLVEWGDSVYENKLKRDKALKRYEDFGVRALHEGFKNGKKVFIISWEYSWIEAKRMLKNGDGSYTEIEYEYRREHLPETLNSNKPSTQDAPSSQDGCQQTGPSNTAPAQKRPAESEEDSEPKAKTPAYGKNHLQLMGGSTDQNDMGGDDEVPENSASTFNASPSSMAEEERAQPVQADCPLYLLQLRALTRHESPRAINSSLGSLLKLQAEHESVLEKIKKMEQKLIKVLKELEQIEESLNRHLDLSRSETYLSDEAKKAQMENFIKLFQPLLEPIKEKRAKLKKEYLELSDKNHNVIMKIDKLIKLRN